MVNEMTPLMKACLSVDCDVGAVRALLERGIDVNARDGRGYTALHCAAMADWSEEDAGRMRLLIDAGANLEARANTQGGRGWTPLMLAAAEGHAAQVKVLIEAGANIEATDDDGRTPLMLAVSQGWETEKKTRLLLEAGSDVRKQCQLGKNAVNYAIDYISTLSNCDPRDVERTEAQVQADVAKELEHLSLDSRLKAELGRYAHRAPFQLAGHISSTIRECNRAHLLLKERMR